MRGVNVVLDLMVDEGGGVRILELQGFGRSGFSGYKKSYKTDFRAQTTDRLRARGIRIVKAPLLFNHMCKSKTASASFAYPLVPQIFPRQRAYAYTGDESLETLIAGDFPGAGRVVLKIPDAARGEGVFFAETATMTLPGLSEYKTVNCFGDFLKVPDTPSAKPRMPKNGHIVVQECVRPRSVVIEGGTYLPTIRAAFTIAWNGDEPPESPDALKVIYHGAYYKLPPQPVNKGDGEDQAGEDFVCNETLKSNVHTERGAAKVRFADALAVRKQCPPALSTIFSFAANHCPEDLVMSALEGSNPGDVVSAIYYMRELEQAGIANWTPEFRARRLKALESWSRDMPPLPGLIVSTGIFVKQEAEAFLPAVRVSENEVAARAKACAAFHDRRIHPLRCELDHLRMICGVVRTYSGELPLSTDQKDGEKKTRLSARKQKKKRDREMKKTLQARLIDQGFASHFLYFAGYPVPRCLSRLESHIGNLSKKMAKLVEAKERDLDPGRIRAMLEKEKLREAIGKDVYQQTLAY